MSDDPQREAWALWLRERMEARGLAVRDVAKACETGKGTVQGWMNGSYPAAPFVRPLARALRVSAEEVLDAVEAAVVVD